MEVTPDLKKKLDVLTSDPGVYLMKDVSGVIIYVGKAKNLRNRVRTYFQGDHKLSPKTRALVKNIADFSFMVVSNEVEALLLERNLIRHHQPRYNVLLRDDKEYPFVRVNEKDPWPRFQKVRRRKDDGATYLGPFANAASLHQSLELMYRVFPLIRCSEHEFKQAKRPCNYYHMKKCLGPCVLPVDPLVYKEIVRNAILFLQNKNQKVSKEILSRMLQAAEEENFEMAAVFRDQLQALKDIQDTQQVVSQTIKEADIFGYYQESSQEHFAISVLSIRQHRLLASQNYFMENPLLSTEEALESLVMQYYSQREVPSCLILPFPLSEESVILHALNAPQTKILIPKVATKKKILDLAHRNAQRFFVEQIHISQRTHSQLEILQKELHLPQLPLRMECIDISNFQETAIVASNVCFVEGKPAKKFYRKYKIKTLGEKPDDYASMREVVTRRCERAMRDGDAPDLLVIDGGKGQLKVAVEVQKQFPELQFPIVGLAKSRTIRQGTSLDPVSTDERVILAQGGDPIPLTQGSSSYRLLTHLRDEAHRFAITYHRVKRKEERHSSQLESIKGLGPVLRKRLFEHFGSLDKMRDAQLSELLSLKGMTERIAFELKEKLLLFK